MANGYINPQLLAVLAAQGVQLPGVPQSAPGPGGPAAPPPQPPAQGPLNAPMPLSPEMQNPPQPLPQVPAMNSINDGINSVGRPSDLDARSQAGLEEAKSDDDRRKLMRQSKGEALLALGAQLLSAPTLGEGMSKGLLAYVKTMRDVQRPKHEESAGGAFDRITDPLTGEVTYKRTPVADYLENKVQVVQDGKLGVATIGYKGKVDAAGITANGAMDRTVYRTDAEKAWRADDRVSREGVAQLNADSRETVARINGTYRAQNRGPNKFELGVMQAAQDAGNDLQTYGQIEALLDEADTGAGSGLWDKAKRAYVGATGQSSFGINVDHMQQLQAHISQMKAKASLMKGQGQISNYERQIMDQALPSLDTNPASIRQLLQVFKQKAERDAAGLGIKADGSTYSLTDNQPEASPAIVSGQPATSADDLRKKYGLK